MSRSNELIAQLSWRHLGSLAAAFILAMMIRFWGVGDAILLDDEFHALKAANIASFSYLFTHFGVADYCIPLAMGYKLMHALTGWSEWLIRLPILVAGLLFCALIPILAYPAIRSSALGWLIAIAPFHIFYSRYARPYAIALLLGLLVMLALWRALRANNRRWLFLAVPCAILAPWFHLAFLPPLVVTGAVVSAWMLTARGQPLRSAWFVGLGMVLAGWGLMLGPPLMTDMRALSSKSSLSRIDACTLAMMVKLLTGMLNIQTGLLLIAAAMLGLCVLGRREPWLALLLILAGGTQLGVVLFTHPAAIHEGVVLARYTLFCYALYLMSLAAAAAWAAEMCTGWRKGLTTVLLAALGCSMVAAGPLPHLAQIPPEWRHHCMFHYDYDWAASEAFAPATFQFQEGECSPFYATLRKLPPGSVSLLEAPWYYEYGYNPLPFYAAFHRQHTAIAFVGKISGHRQDGDLPLEQYQDRFRHFEQLGSTTFNRLAKADFLVIHKSWSTEMPYWVEPPVNDSEKTGSLLAYCRTQFGGPKYEDALLAVFPLTPKAMALEIEAFAKPP